MQEGIRKGCVLVSDRVGSSIRQNASQRRRELQEIPYRKSTTANRPQFCRKEDRLGHRYVSDSCDD